MPFELDTTQFRQAVEFVFHQTRRTLPDIINRAALVCIIGGAGVQGAMQRTMKASKERIKSVPVNLVAGYVMNKHKGEKLTRQQINQLIDREYKRRVAAIGYTARVGWNNAAMQLGGRGIGSKAHGKGYAAFGYALPATMDASVAEIANTAPAADLIGREALQAAVNDTAQDMVEYAGGKFQDIFNQVRP